MTPSTGNTFTHQDHIVRGKRLPLRIINIDRETIIAICDDDQPDKNGVWPRLFCFPKGLNGKEITWIKKPLTEIDKAGLSKHIAAIEVALAMLPEGEPIPYNIATEGIIVE